MATTPTTAAAGSAPPPQRTPVPVYTSAPPPAQGAPPAGYEVEPVAGDPGGYSTADVPNYLKGVARTVKIVQAPADGSHIATVYSNKPTEIDIQQPDQVTQHVLDHELTHVYQMGLNPAIVAKLVGEENSQAAAGRFAAHGTAGAPGYSYGGMDGLIAAQGQNKTVMDFNAEQQAEMFADYEAITRDAIKRGDAALYNKAQAAYGPLLQQFVNLPRGNEPMTRLPMGAFNPPAQGRPPATPGGWMAADPNLGDAPPASPPRGYTLEPKTDAKKTGGKS